MESNYIPLFMWLLFIHALTHWGRDKIAAIYTGDIFKCIFLNENIRITLKISLEFVPKAPVNNNPALV